MKKFNVGIQLYGVRNAMAQDFEGTLKAVKEMGYDYVEFAGYYGKTAEEIKEILDRIGLPLMFPELDTGWVHYAGLRPDQKIRQFSGNVPVVHLKDFVCKNLAAGPVYELIDKDGNSKKGASHEDNGFEYCPLGRGRQNFAEILAACEECGTETVIVEQDETYGMTELEAARISREYLRDTFGL